ncbi:MAG TPA: VWA domain-containing protein [Thermoanaerobaculia bacterium]|nr:VWA domain-containing protein [Thermoanaerobaculia bacterium]
MQSFSWTVRLLAAALCLTQPLSAAEDRRFSAGADVVVVEVPVQVLRDGKPVRGLTAADFQVFQGRAAQAITGFEVLDLATVPADNPEAVRRLPLSARRRFVFLFDLGFSSPVAMTKAREAAKQILQRSFHPTDLVAVAAYVPSRGPELLLGFSADRRQVEAVIDNLSPVQNKGITADPLLLASAAQMAGADQIGTAGRQAGGGGGPRREQVGQQQSDQQAESQVEPEYHRPANVSANMALERNEREASRAQLTAFTKSLSAFASVLAAVEGRKNILFLSEGFDSALVMGTVDEAEIQAMENNALAGDVWNIDSDKRYGNTKAGNDLEKMFEALRRADCAVHAVDIGGVRSSPDDLRAARSKGADGLFLMARSTGGEMYQNFNDLAAAMDKTLERTSVTYVLSIQPDVKPDGEYHKLRVELNNDRGTRVVYRPGFYAPKPYAQQSAVEKMLQTAGRVVSGREGGPVGLSVLAAPFKGKGDKAYVPVLIEIDGASLTAGSEGALPTEVYVYALDAQGVVQDFFTQTLALDLAKVGPAVRGGGVKFFGDLDLPPGPHSVRVLVRNGQTGAAGMRVASLEVPAFAQGGPVLLPAFFPEAPGRWLMVREAKLRQGEVPYPFLNRNQPYVPASRPALAAGQVVPFALVGYGLGAGRLTALARVMTPDGKEAGEGTVEILGRESSVAGGADRLSASFRAPRLQPGEYLLLLTLTGDGGAAQTSVAPFVIAGEGTSPAKR